MTQTDHSEAEWSDQLALRDLLTRYAASCDDRNWAQYRAIFTDDAYIDYTAAYGIDGPRDAVAEWIADLMAIDTLPSTQHLLSNFRIEIAAGAASGRVDYFNPDVIADREGNKELLLNGGYYEFEARRSPDHWKISRLKATILWSHRTELSVVELPSAGDPEE
jgi:3-phenylpropionate/cinnamic acid dioxygenase small subunit